MQTTAQELEFQIDELIVGTMPHEGERPIRVVVTDEEFALLKDNHDMAWRVVTGPITAAIVLILDLGDFWVSWDVQEGQARALWPYLLEGDPLPLVVGTRSGQRLELRTPRFPDGMLVFMERPYRPVAAA
jgi:hypothetical protein